ncbi:hypothetical protein AB0L00_22780 [Actinoallomurus sp. NPDC052308]|uniref:hypothetical protein n=1 Tax=Actinoallomurus sp. NPDC052308 TaxID=3155530 RepID=UPI00342B1144
MTRRGVDTATPPWIWLFLIGYLAIGVPDSIGAWHRQLADYSGHGSVSPALTSLASFTLLKIFAAVELLPVAFLTAGVAGVALPAVRARWVERRSGLVPDDRPVMAEMRRFVQAYAPGVELRATLRPGRLARVYPVGLRRARIAVFQPMAALWRRDRAAAQAVLLHEIAHVRQRDHLIVGLGSPFPWLVRVWAPAFLLAEILPATIFFTLRPNLVRRAGRQARRHDRRRDARIPHDRELRAGHGAGIDAGHPRLPRRRPSALGRRPGAPGDVAAARPSMDARLVARHTARMSGPLPAVPRRRDRTGAAPDGLTRPPALRTGGIGDGVVIAAGRDRRTR